MDFHALQPEVMSTEMAEDVMEASFARGLAAAECFEVRPAHASAFLRFLDVVVMERVCVSGSVSPAMA